jgi:protein tyrosine/serine phosphatase
VGELRQRTFQFSRVFNFRDVGGYVGLQRRSVRWRRLFRSDNLCALGEADRSAFRQLGVRTVLDLRRSYECQSQGQVPQWDGLAYHNIDPGHPEWALTPYEDGLDPVRYLADRYRDMAEEGAAGLATAIGMVADEQTAPVVVHCVAGKDRTGVVCALTLSLLGVSDDDIDHDYSLSTRGNQRYLAWARTNGQPDLVMHPWYYSPPGTMKLFLAELRQRHGSVETYLTGAGLAPDHITALRSHLLA